MSENIGTNIKDTEEFKNLSDFFDNFIKDGAVRKTKEVAPDFVVTVRALSVEEILNAELKVQKASEGITIKDIYVRIRACSILSIAIEQLGDKPVYTDAEIAGLTEEDMKSRTNKQAALYLNLLKLPPQLIEKIYELYLDETEVFFVYYKEIKNRKRRKIKWIMNN